MTSKALKLGAIDTVSLSWFGPGRENCCEGTPLVSATGTLRAAALIVNFIAHSLPSSLTVLYPDQTE